MSLASKTTVAIYGKSTIIPFHVLFHVLFNVLFHVVQLRSFETFLLCVAYIYDTRLMIPSNLLLTDEHFTCFAVFTIFTIFYKIFYKIYK